jgi:molecular chaperone DnaK
MADGSGMPPGPPQPPGSPPSGKPGSPGGKRPAIGLQIKLPCATLDEVKARYGEELRQNKFFIRTKAPRAKETLVRLEAQLSTGTLAFRAAAVVVAVQDPPEAGMRLQLLGVDEAGRELITSLGGKPPPLLKIDPPKLATPSTPSKAAAPGIPSEAAAPSPPSKPPAPSPPSKPPAPSPPSRPAAPSLPSMPAAPPLPSMPAAPSIPSMAAAPSIPSMPAAPPLPSMPRAPPLPAKPAVPGIPSKPSISWPPPPPVEATEPEAARPPEAPKQAAGPAPAEKPAAKKGPMIGIDLGTTNSAAAVVKDGKPFVIPSREGYNTIPSIVAMNEKGKVIVGHPAKSQLLINPKDTVFGAKRLVGRQFASPVVSELINRVPYQIVAGPSGEAAVQLGKQQFSLQQISALVLGEVKEIAQQWLQTAVARAVITVPAHYNDNQRHAVREAGELAGLKVERIVNEPTAAALAFAHGRKLNQRVLVYDLGGGTFDASVVELRGNVCEVVSTGGDTFLGGVDFDKVLVDHLLASFKEKHGIDFPGDRVALQRVTDAAERAKIALSEQLEYNLKVPFVALVGDKPYDLEVAVSRSELVLLTGHLVERTLKVCGEVLGLRGLKPEDMADVLLVGGQSRMPLVRERIRNYFGREPSRVVHPDEAVALGAALLAHSLDSGESDRVLLIDVLPMSIGVGLPGGRFRKIIERNTSLPFEKSLMVSTTRDDQKSLEVSIFQGDSDKAQENEYLGTLVIPGLPKAVRGTLSFDIVFSLSPESILTVTAENKASGKSATATFSTKDTPDEVKKRLAESAVTDGDGAAPSAGGQGGGFFGWLRRLFGGKPAEPRA